MTIRDWLTLVALSGRADNDVIPAILAASQAEGTDTVYLTDSVNIQDVRKDGD